MAERSLKARVPWLAGVTVLALLVRLGYLSRISGYPSFAVPYAGLDGALYHGLAQRVAAGDLELGTDVFYYSPLYAYFLGGLYFLFGSGPWVARLANVLLGAGTVSLLYLFTRRLCRSRLAAAVTGAGAALYGPFVVFDTSGLKATLGQVLIVLGLYLVSRATEARRAPLGAGAGVVWGLAANINGQAALFVALLAAAVLLGVPPASAGEHPPSSLRQRSGHAFLLAAGFFLAVAPFFLRNYLVAGESVPIKTGEGIHIIYRQPCRRLGRLQPGGGSEGQP